MKTKLKLRNGGVRNHPYWHIIVQGDKKNLNGKYIERVGYWMPRKTRTIHRGIVLNKHKVRYWLSMGAEPTKGVVRLLNKFDFFPKTPVPWGSANLYEKPDKEYKIEGWKDHFKSRKNMTWKYKQMLQEQINVVERQRRIQAEAMANLGSKQDVELLKTDDIDSEEVDIFSRVEKFEELNKRFEKHRKEQWKLKGNDLRYNVYLKKMNKLTRMDLGLDIEGYKDYVNNLKEFAKYNKDWEVLAEDNATPMAGTMNSQYSAHTTSQLLHSSASVNQNQIDERREQAQMAAGVKQLKNTVLKLFREHYSRLHQRDVDIVAEFEKDPLSFLDNDADLAIQVKRLYDKRVQQVKERNQMNTYHIEKVTDKDLERCGVSKREFDMIKKLMKLDKHMFAVKEYEDSSPYTYIVDLSKYEDQKIPQDCKEILFRPNKMRILYEKYWAIASELDKKDAQDKLDFYKIRWNSTRYLSKGDDEFRLMDKIVDIIDSTLKKLEADFEKNPLDQKKVAKDIEKRAKAIATGQQKRFFQDSFELHAENIMQQIKQKGFCTKSQLEYLILYNEIEGIQKPYRIQDFDNVTFLKDEDEYQKHDFFRVRAATDTLKQVKVEALPDELREKFEQLEKNLTFQERSDILSWFVDSMRVQVLNHLEESFQDMNPDQKTDLINELNDLQKKCSDQLFEMHQSTAKGEYVEPNDYLAGLQREILEFRSRLDVAFIERKQLEQIRYHNRAVDLLSSKFPEKQASIEKFLPYTQDQDSQLDDPQLTRLNNLEMMEPGEAYDLIQRLNRKAGEFESDTQQEYEDLLTEFEDRLYTAKRHRLNYAKLYHGLDGGYSMEKLKKVLKRIKSDVRDNLHPFIDPRDNERVESQLRKILQLRIDERAANQAEGEAEAEAEGDEDGERPKTAEELILESIEEDEEKELTKELLKMAREKREKEIAEDLADGDLEEGDPEMLDDKDIAEIMELYKQEHGLHLEEIEDEEELKDAWIEWVKSKLPERKSKKTTTYLDQKVAELKVKRPELVAILDELQTQPYSQSLVSGDWIPDRRNWLKEMDRVEANIGRYPVGFRHYENWQNYNMKYPEKTIDDYQIDMNSQITFDEFQLLHKKAFLYECQHNPEVIHQYGLQDIDSEDEFADQRDPEYIVGSQEFESQSRQIYQDNVHDKLLNKEWFKKVDALEMFTDFWSFGRGLHAMPSHNIYVPVNQTIMPRPKLRDYDKEDQLGLDFTYRTRDSHTHHKVKTADSTLQPSPFSPPLPNDEFAKTEYIYQEKVIPKHKFHKDRRLSKNKRQNSINFPLKWKFSTGVGMSQEQEQKEKETFYATQGLSMTIDKNPYSLWGKFAMIIFK